MTSALVLATQHLTVADATSYMMVAHHPALVGAGARGHSWLTWNDISDWLASGMAAGGAVWERFSKRCLRRMANVPMFRQQLTKITDLLLVRFPTDFTLILHWFTLFFDCFSTVLHCFTLFFDCFSTVFWWQFWWLILGLFSNRASVAWRACRQPVWFHLFLAIVLF